MKEGRKEGISKQKRMMQFPWTTTKIPSQLLMSQWAQPRSDELLLSMQESAYEEKLNEIRKGNSNLVVIGQKSADHDKEEYDNDVDDDDVDNVDESEGEEFEQETS